MFHYDPLGRIVEEKDLAENTKICYTYDSLNRMTKRTVLNACDDVLSEENYSYDAAGNITDAPDSCFQYDTNNRLVIFKGQPVEYDADGNMLTDGETAYVYDSANRLIKAGDHAYTYNAEDVRIRNRCIDFDTTYTYNTNCKLSQLLMKSTNGNITKYVYGLGLIAEEKWGECKIYHFDYRGSTVALTRTNGAVTDTFRYDAYGQLTERTGDSFIIFGYNGRDGVVTDKNGLIYMRARYYSPLMKRFINADVLHGEISDSVTLNRYAYANGNPVSNVDPFGLSVERGGPTMFEAAYLARHIYNATDADKKIPLGSKYRGWILDDILVDKDGFKMGLYSRTVDGKMEYAIVNKGSSTTNDWIDNFLQPLGLSSDMKESISIADQFVRDNPDANITFVGHSKGGGEALANARATNRNAIVFNPAIPNYLFYGLGAEPYTAKATSYVMPGELLSTVYLAGYAISTPLGSAIGVIKPPILAYAECVFQSRPFWETWWFQNESWDPKYDHSMDAIIALWEEE